MTDHATRPAALAADRVHARRGLPPRATSTCCWYARRRPALPHRLRRAAPGAADLPRAAGRRPAHAGRPAARGAGGRQPRQPAPWASRSSAGARPRTPSPLVAAALPGWAAPGRGRLGNRMWAEQVLRCAPRCPARSSRWPARCCASCGCARTPAEVAALRAAGAAIDRVHARMGEWLRPGRTEREVGGDIAEAIVGRGARDGRLRHRRLGAERRQPAPRRLRPGDGGRRPGGRRHRRADRVGLLLRLAPASTPSGEPAAGGPRLLRGAAGRPEGARGRGAAGRHRRGGGRRGARRHRGGRATASTSSTAPGTASAWRSTRSPYIVAGNTSRWSRGWLLGRAGHLPARRVRRPDRGHRASAPRTASERLNTTATP